MSRRSVKDFFYFCSFFMWEDSLLWMGLMCFSPCSKGWKCFMLCLPDFNHTSTYTTYGPYLWEGVFCDLLYQYWCSLILIYEACKFGDGKKNKKNKKLSVFDSVNMTVEIFSLCFSPCEKDRILLSTHSALTLDKITQQPAAYQA